MYKLLFRVWFLPEPTIEQKTAHVCKPFPTNTHTHTPSIPFVHVTNTFHPKLLPLLGRCRCEKREARSLRQRPSGHHGNSSNKPVVGVGLTAKFVVFPKTGFPSITLLPPTGSLGRSRRGEVKTPRRGRRREERKKEGNLVVSHRSPFLLALL